MSLIRSAQVCAGVLVFAFGCRSAPSADLPASMRAEPMQVQATPASKEAPTSIVETVSFQEGATEERSEQQQNDQTFPGEHELALHELVAEVEARNPSIQAMIATWRAAAQRYPQEVSLEDPMFGFMVGPASWGSDEVDSAYMLDASQKLPWPGKRQLRGRVAQSEASASRFDVEDTRLRIIETAQLSYFEYYLAARQRELNEEGIRVMQEFREAAQARYRANQVTQQDVLQSDVELAEMQRRNIELERMQNVSVARINTLLRRAPNDVLPPPPQVLNGMDGLPLADQVQQVAIERRPDIAALQARVRAERASAELACQEFYPDFEVVARYDAFWQEAEKDLRPQVGMNMNLPVYKERRRAAAREAMYRVAQRRAEVQQRIDDVRNDVQAAYERLIEAQRVLDLYDSTLLPAAEQNVSVARSAYVTARLGFLRLIEAQRQVIQFRERRLEAEVSVRMRLAELERLAGGPVVPN